MSGAKLRLTCLVWPAAKRPDQHCFEVNIDNDQTVMFLKKLIEDGLAPMLNKVAACHLVLWKCSISVVDVSLQKTLNTVRFKDTEDFHRLPPVSLVSEHFATSLSPEIICILVEIPALGECSTHIFYYLMLKGLVSPAWPEAYKKITKFIVFSHKSKHDRSRILVHLVDSYHLQSTKVVSKRTSRQVQSRADT